ncbi:MAG: aminodeoxychorismate/anthranilate synthase component II [Succinivibrio sp.]|jgi:anthranilate synthase component 2|nr:aminodeoxychorismate/anthranilate synthase component II [Succinivibrio sp.]
MKRRIIFIDNYDSFSYNLTDEFRVLGNEVTVYRNDADPLQIMTLLEQASKAGEKPVLVLSPGPSAPDDANNLVPIIKKALGKFPMLGICLGHQALGQVLGGRVVRASEIIHGKSSDITHCGKGAFTGLPNPLKVARYHSLVVEGLPKNVEVTATCGKLVMALRESRLNVTGFQFHPESIMTAYGRQLLAQALDELTA